MTTHEPGVYINSKGKKTFVPLENNPEVFTDLVHRLGVSSKLGFYDIYSIDEADLLALVPRPVHALIFIAPADVYHRVRAKDGGSNELTYDGSGEQEPVMWFKQTIGHSCGLMALIHSVGNGPAKQFIVQDSLLDNLLKQSLPLKPLPRADVLYNSAELEKAHMASAFKRIGCKNWRVELLRAENSGWAKRCLIYFAVVEMLPYFLINYEVRNTTRNIRRSPAPIASFHSLTVVLN